MKSLGIIVVVVFLAASYSAAETPYSTAKQYLNLWQSGDYFGMYQLLSNQSKDYVSKSEFIDEHRDFAREFTIQDFEITEKIVDGQRARIYYRLYLTRVGSGESISQSGNLEFTCEDYSWKINY